MLSRCHFSEMSFVSSQTPESRWRCFAAAKASTNVTDVVHAVDSSVTVWKLSEEKYADIAQKCTHTVKYNYSV